jgi:hypothetical protein
VERRVALAVGNSAYRNAPRLVTAQRQQAFSYGSVSGRQDFYFVAGQAAAKRSETPGVRRHDRQAFGDIADT